MPTVNLSRIAMARSGDKGEGSNAGVIARSDAAYAFLEEHLTADVVKAHVAGLNDGGVRRLSFAEAGRVCRTHMVKEIPDPRRLCVPTV